ncbi:MAG: hypothetical protein PHN57_08670, partial [Candidatus Omnitrophica bacterium]|nr:hypothetical protein [Candidatus Omnitrophota bacterium]
MRLKVTTFVVKAASVALCSVRPVSPPPVCQVRFTVMLPIAFAVKLAGAAGGAAGFTLFEGADAGLVPIAL